MDGSDAEPSEPTGRKGSIDAGVRRFDLSRSTVGELASTTESVAGATLNADDVAGRNGTVSSVLVGVGGGPHSGATVDFARTLAEEADAWIDLFHVASAAVTASDPEAETKHAEGDRLLDAAADRLDGFERADRWLVESYTPADAIVEQSAYYDVVIVGAPTTGTIGRFVFGCTTDAVVDDAAVPVIVVESDGSTGLIEDD